MHRLYAKGVMVGFKRGLRNQYEHTSLLKIENVKEKKDVDFYLGKRVCFIYKAQNEVRGSKFRTIWGRVTRAHGSRSAAFHFTCYFLSGCQDRKQQAHRSVGGERSGRIREGENGESESRRRMDEAFLAWKHRYAAFAHQSQNISFCLM